jgi:hypothetical protein
MSETSFASDQNAQASKDKEWNKDEEPLKLRDENVADRLNTFDSTTSY